ncbi:MAG: NADH-quinone oxidoreductase subunit NuoK [Candidatus Xenobia bacterium]
MTIGLQHYLVLGTLLFAIGLFGVLTRKNAVGVLLSLELMFNAVNLNLLGFNRYMPLSHGQIPGLGQAFAVFIIAVAAAEATLGVAIVLSIYRNFHHINLDEVDLLKW